MSIDLALASAAAAAAALGVMVHSILRTGLSQVLLLICLVAYLMPQTQLPLPAGARAVGLLAIFALGVHALTARNSGLKLSRSTAVALGFVLVSALWSDGTDTDVAVQTVFLLALITLAAARTSERDLHRALVITLVLLGLITLGMLLLSPASLYLAGRLRGPMVNPNSFALMTILLYPVVTKWKLWASAPATVAGMAMIWETGSRAALLAFGVQVVLSVFGSLRLFGRIVAISALGVLATYLTPIILSTAATQGAGSESVLRGNNSRDMVWQLSSSQVEEAPWLGSGLGSITSDFETGSSIFSVLILTGIVGLTLVTFALFAAMFRGVTNAPLSDWRLVLLAGGLTNALFEGWLVAAGTAYALIFWVVLESLARDAKRGDTKDLEQGENGTRRRRSRGERTLRLR